MRRLATVEVYGNTDVRGQSHTYAQIMQLGVLGSAQASSIGVAIDLGPRKQRALLAALVLHRGQSVPVDSIVDLLWPASPPPGVGGTLQTYVAGLRRALEPDRPARSTASMIVTAGGGYALTVPDDDLDVTRFHTAVAGAHDEITPLQVLGERGAVAGDRLEKILDSIDQALKWWRGTPYLELGDAPAVVAERVRLERLRLLAHEDRAVIGLSLGRHAAVAADLDVLTAEHPLHERLWALQAVALARSGRQAEALDTLQRVRNLLAEELGIEPGSELRSVQAAVLRQDPAVDPPSAARATAPHRAATGTTQWPMVGRERPFAALTTLLDEAANGYPRFATLVGEPGIGKSRLVDELADVARDAGAEVLIGRCSQDEGAPPLWSWTDVFGTLGLELPRESGDADGGTRFRIWDSIVRTILDHATDRTLVLVLDDLHWADASSLRVLRLLVEGAHAGRLLVIATWRDKPTPTALLGSVAESFARRHAVRLELEGLTAEDSARIVNSITSSTPSPADAEELRARSDGNPFFVVEYARLAAEHGDLGTLLSEASPPSAVGDVLALRLSVLPDSTVVVLGGAAVIGRSFDLPALAATTMTGADDLLDLLDPASAAGLLRDDGVDRFRFTHALVRDAVYASIPSSRRAALHARVAVHRESAAGHESEVARHWLAAGPAHAARGWRAALNAAAAANSIHAYEEAVDLSKAARNAQAHDPDVTAADQHAGLMTLAEALRRTGDWTEARAVVHDAISVGRASGDIELVARAAVSTSTDALWQAVAHGTIDSIVVAALREALDALPTGDGELRSRVMLALAFEIYYGTTTHEREALATEGVAMARRLDDPGLLLTAIRMAFVAVSRAATTDSRLLLIDEALQIAERLHDDRGMTTALTLRAALAYETGDIATGASVGRQARRLAEQQRHFYAQVVLDTLEVPWLAMAGRHAEAAELTEHLRSLGERLTVAQYEDALGGAQMFLLLWQGRAEDVVPGIVAMAERSALPLSAIVAMFMIRAGQIERARAYLQDDPIDLSGDTWFSLFTWGAAAEVALALGDADLGAESYALLAPFAGRACCANSSVAMGPVDAFLALAAAASGANEVATTHADQAIDLCQTWDVPMVTAWLQDHRDAHHF